MMTLSFPVRVSAPWDLHGLITLNPRYFYQNNMDIIDNGLYRTNIDLGNLLIFIT